MRPGALVVPLVCVPAGAAGASLRFGRCWSVGAARVTIISGTKAYTGITGSFNVTISYVAVLPLKNGKCNPNGNANPTATIGSVAATGTVSYG